MGSELDIAKRLLRGEEPVELVREGLPKSTVYKVDKRVRPFKEVFRAGRLGAALAILLREWPPDCEHYDEEGCCTLYEREDPWLFEALGVDYVEKVYRSPDGYEGRGYRPKAFPELCALCPERAADAAVEEVLREVEERLKSTPTPGGSHLTSCKD